MDETLECAEHKGFVARLLHRDGEVRTYVASVAAPPVPQVPAGASVFLATVFAAVAVMLVTVVASSACAMERAWRYFSGFLRFHNVSPKDVSPWVVMSYMLCRCYPPVGVPLPAHMQSRVTPKTAAQDLTALRRRARLMKDTALLDALTDEDVLRLGGVLGANVKRTKTEKAPILMHHLQALWESRAARMTLGFLRNMLMLVVGLVAGLRRREIVALRVDDCVWSSERQELVLRIRRDKTNGVITDAQFPRVLCVAHPLLTAVWGAWAASPLGTGRKGTAPMFPALAGDIVTERTLDPGTVNTIVREMLPGIPVSPHSLRVGFATELHAAGTELHDLLEMGRWASLAGLLYVLPSADKTAAATRRMGDGSVTFDRVLLQKALRTAPVPPRVRRMREA
jgi:integrase